MPTKKEAIAVYALELIGKKGYSSLSYDDIARQFDITKAAVHYHYKNKEDLGIAVCELLSDRLLAVQEYWLDACRKGRHPWQYFEERLKALPLDGICPIAGMLADYDNLPEPVRTALARLCQVEIEMLHLLVRTYDEGIDASSLTVLLLSCKGALQYRHVMGERFFKDVVKAVRKQCYAIMPRRK